MKHLSILFILFLSITQIKAQETEVPDSLNFDETMRSIVMLSDAASEGDTIAINYASGQLKLRSIEEFSDIRCEEDSALIIDGQFNFNEYITTETTSGQSRGNVTRNITGHNGSTKSKTFTAKAHQSVPFSFTATGKRRIGVVAGPGGLISLKVNVSNRKGLNKNYNDTKNVWNGERQRQRTLDLPTDSKCVVKMEVTNCTDNAISFVIITN